MWRPENPVTSHICIPECPRVYACPDCLVTEKLPPETSSLGATRDAPCNFYSTRTRHGGKSARYGDEGIKAGCIQASISFPFSTFEVKQLRATPSSDHSELPLLTTSTSYIRLQDADYTFTCSCQEPSNPSPVNGSSLFIL